MVLLTVVGCVPIEPSGRPFEPVTLAAAVPEDPPPDADFDFEAADRPEADAPAGRGTEAPTVTPAPGPAASVPTVGAILAPLPGAPALADLPPPSPGWTPGVPLPDVRFGVRVVATLVDVQPPRAVLGLADGREEVVRPGSMLEDEGIVVLAIGQDAVHIARVTPRGFHASVETETLVALYPAARPAP